MKKSFLSIFVCMLLFSIALITVDAEKSNQFFQIKYYGNTLYVGGSGPGNYSLIQNAIDNASNGDTVFVFPGIYDEHIIIDKSINLVGQNKIDTIIDAHGYDAVLITENSVKIEGFTIEYGGSGVILFYCTDSKIEDNIIRFNDHHGVYAISSVNILLSENTISNNVLDGINFEMSMMGTISENVISDNGNFGLYLIGNSTNNEIFKNRILRNRNGIGISSQCSTNGITENVIRKNSGKGVNVFQDCDNNWFLRNDFIKNEQSAYDCSSNIWDDGAKGNYWDDYNGKDLNPKDGIGDTPYIIPGGDNQDNYPLMEPYNTVNLNQKSLPFFFRILNKIVNLLKNIR